MELQFTILQSVYKKDNPTYLNEAFQSIFDNSIQPKTIVLVKDGIITPELDTVISSWGTKLPLKVIGYEKNQGLAYALNYGLKYVETDFVARMDSDDICFPNRFEKQLNFFEKNQNVEIVGTGLSEFYIDKYNNEIKRIRLYPQIITNASKYLFKGTPLAHPTVMMRTKLLKEFKYSENTHLCEDIDLWFRLIKSGHVIYNLQEPLLHFRITDGTFRRRSVLKAISEFKIYWKNLYTLFGITVLLIYPVARFITRFLPYSFSKLLYFSKSRKTLFSYDCKRLH